MSPKAKSTIRRPRRAPVSHEKGNVIMHGRTVPVEIFPFETMAEQLAARIIEDIEAGTLPAGMVLPDRPELSRRYRGSIALNQRSVADALEILAYRGYTTLGTEYGNTHRRIITHPHRYTSQRHGEPTDLLPKLIRQELPSADTIVPNSLLWEPVNMTTTPPPNEFSQDFATERDNSAKTKLFRFTDRLWAGHEVVSVHRTWVYPYPELSLAIVNILASQETATLRDIEHLVAVYEADDTIEVSLATPEQRGAFLIGSKFTDPIALVVISRRVYNATHTLVFVQSSWYRADRFRFHYPRITVSEQGTWLPQP